MASDEYFTQGQPELFEDFYADATPEPTPQPTEAQLGTKFVEDLTLALAGPVTPALLAAGIDMDGLVSILRDQTMAVLYLLNTTAEETRNGNTNR